MEIVDGHVHIQGISDPLSYFGPQPPAADTPWDIQKESDLRVRAMDAIGVAWAVIQPTHGYLRPDGIKDTMRINDGVARFRDTNPKRFPLACGTVEPMHGTRTLAELERM